MSEWVWINGRVSPLADARVGVEDRGFQFADGVYEVLRLYQGRPFALGPHLDRLERSCGGIDLTAPARQTLMTAIYEVLRLSALSDGMVYLQVTRGEAPRNHLFPRRPAGFSGTLLCYARALEPLPPAGSSPGVSLVTVPDERWKRCWVKSIALLPNVLAKNRAAAAGADEAVFVEDGVVSECSASNLLAVLDGRLVTHPVGPKVLPGVTRAALLKVAREIGVAFEERKLTEAEARRAAELFITSTTREISWVARWNGRPVGDASGAGSAGGAGRCGPITLRLHRALRERIRREASGPSDPAVAIGCVDSCPAGV